MCEYEEEIVQKAPKATHCEFCKKELDNSRNSTTRYRTDNFCSARCKRKNNGKYYDKLGKRLSEVE